MTPLPRLLQRGRPLLQGLAEGAKVLWRGPSPAPTTSSSAAADHAARLESGRTVQRAPPLQGLADRAKRLWSGRAAPTPISADRAPLPSAPTPTTADGLAAPTPTAADGLPRHPMRVEKRGGPYRRSIRRRLTTEGAVKFVFEKTNELDRQQKITNQRVEQLEKESVLHWIGEAAAAIPVILWCANQLKEELLRLKDYLKKLAKNASGEDLPQPVVDVMGPW